MKLLSGLTLIATIRLRRAGVALALVWVVATISQAQTYRETVLHSFTQGKDGGGPQGPLIRDRSGNLYGTTVGGGIYNWGTVFKVDSKGATTIFLSFGGGDGAQPYGGLLRDASGNLYGTASDNGTSGYGVVFKLAPSGTETVLLYFDYSDGGFPDGGLIRDAAGNIYGMTSEGGTNGSGTVFKLESGGKEVVLHSFDQGSDGGFPYLGYLVRDRSGNLYGTTANGGTGQQLGVVFKLDKAGHETVLHEFKGGSDGANPWANVILDRFGNLYGTTYEGGDPRCNCGVVFKLDKSGAASVLYRFHDGLDGAAPASQLAFDKKGTLYGTAMVGGDPQCNCGTVFKVDSAHRFRVLHRFKGKDGALPSAGVILDAAGNIYGTTYSGGTSSNCGQSGCGTVFKLSP